jgi:branched-chain amino acid transport system substrate-binding protein
MVPIDNKLSPQESINAVKSLIDQGVRYVVQGNGSGAALAIIDAVGKHNERNPGKEVVYINYAAVDPDLTNSKCSYWHFRLDADTSMKMEALTTFMKDQSDIKNVYLINQNYAHGHQGLALREGDHGAQAAGHQDRRRRPAPAGAGA